ncbi:MAG: transcription termination factor Rho [Bacillota bacterium]|nr:transcription termination factor Rho [Bacillota bacterium]
MGTKKEYENLSLMDLRDLAKEYGITGISSLRKGELIDLLLKYEQSLPKDEHPELPKNVEIIECDEEKETTPQTEKKKLFDTNTQENAVGFLEILADGYGFLRPATLYSGTEDVFVTPQLIRKYGMKTGDAITGYAILREGERFEALIYIKSINGDRPEKARQRRSFDLLIPTYPTERFRLERDPRQYAMRLIDVVAPVGKGQRGLIVAPPKTGKTTLLKQMAQSIKKNNPEVYLFVLLIDERPEEVTDMRHSVPEADIIYSTFDMPPENHTKVAEMVIERAQRMVEYGKDVVILLDSLTRLARAYNLSMQASGRVLSGGLDSGALHKPKKFFGSARKIENGGSLTILATALVETGSRMDDVIFEEFKGTGNMEIHLDRGLSERRVFPAVDIYKSGTRKEELLLDYEELSAAYNIRRAFSKNHSAEVTEYLLKKMAGTKTNREFIKLINDELAEGRSK